MKRAFIIALFIVMKISSYAQVTSVETGSSYKKTITTKNGQTKTVWLKTLQNTGTSQLEAFLAFAPCGAQGAILTVQDARANFLTNRNVLPSESVTIPSGDPDKCFGGIDGAIFSDGHTEGKPEAIKLLFDRRKGTYDALADITGILKVSLQGSQSVQEAIDKMAAAKEQYVARNKEDIAVGYRTVFVVVTAILQKPERDLRIPSDVTTAHLPTAHDLVISKGYTPERAQSESLFIRLQEWKKVLEGHYELSA